MHDWSSAGNFENLSDRERPPPFPCARELLSKLDTSCLTTHPPPQSSVNPRQLRTAHKAFQNARFCCPRFGRSQGRRCRLQTRPDPDEDVHRPYRLPESRLRPRALPQGAQGLQARPHQGVRRRRPGRHLQPPQDPQVPRRGRPRLEPEGVRDHGRRG